nr:hypothetical protein [Tanacetum cinerariifolium]
MRCMEIRKDAAKHGGDEANDLGNKGVRWQLPWASRVVTTLFLGAQGDRVDACTWSGGPPCCKLDTQHCKILCDVVYIFYTEEVVVTIILIVVVAIVVVDFIVAIIGVVVVGGGGVSSIIKLLFVIIGFLRRIVL